MLWNTIIYNKIIKKDELEKFLSIGWIKKRLKINTKN